MKLFIIDTIFIYSLLPLYKFCTNIPIELTEYANTIETTNIVTIAHRSSLLFYGEKSP